MGQGRAAGRWATAAGACLLLTACRGVPHQSSKSVPATPTTTAVAVRTSASPAPSAALDPAERAALTSYTMMWRSVEADARGGAYNILDLSAYVTGKPLELFSVNLAQWHANGIVMKGASVMSPSVTAESMRSTPQTVDITDRFDDSHALLYYSATSAPVDDKPGGCRVIHATVTDMRGVWRVTSLDMGADKPCASP